MASLTDILSLAVGKAFEAEGLPAGLGQVRVADRPDLAQFQCNGALAAAKAAKKNPRAVAEAVTARLKTDPVFAMVEIAGPGFINLKVTDNYLADYLKDVEKDGAFSGAGKESKGTVIVDYVGANVAKAMHVGHLRPTIIGDCIKRLIRFSGYETLGDVHMGDWGLPMGSIISEFAIRNPEWVYFDPDFSGPYPAEPPFSYGELELIYPQASAACKADKARLDLARKATVELQNGRAGYRALWEHFMTLSRADIKRNCDSLDVDIEIWKGESDVDDIIPVLEKELRDKGLAVESDGALVVPVEEPGDNKPMPPLMYYKSDGAVTYGTTDTATIYDRVRLYPNLKKIVYVVDKRQDLHLEQVFRVMKKGGYVDGIELHSIGFGTLNGPDGKPFKTRDGGVMRFDDLVARTRQKAMERLDEADLAQGVVGEERDDIAIKVATAALKFADLSNQPHVDYIFDIDRMTQFEGKTGPYLLYQGVRIKSLLRKAEEQGFAVGTAADIAITDADRALALLLTEFPDVFDTVLRNLAPHHLCDYAYRLAQEFSRFYGACHILSEGDESLRRSRLALCRATADMLEKTLYLLGISVPDRM